MTEELAPIVSVEVVRAIAANAHDLLIDILEEEDTEAPIWQRQPLALAALRFAALAASELGDVALVDVLASALTMCADLDDYGLEESEAEVLGEAVASLLRRGARADEQVRELAESEVGEVRRAVAAGLAPSGPAEIALLRKLAKDGDAEVRKAARKSLEGVAEVPWWSGKLSSDPAARMTPREVARAEPLLKEIATLMDVQAWHERGKATERIARLAKDLPPVIAADVAEHVLVEPGHNADLGTEQLVGMLLAAPDAEAAIGRLIPRWARSTAAFWVANLVPRAIAALPAKTRAALCASLVGGEIGVDRAAPDALAAEVLAARIGAAAWPDGVDLAPVLDRIEAVQKEHEDDPDESWTQLAWSLGHALAAKPKKGATLARIVELRLACSGPAWRIVEMMLAAHLEQLDGAALRPIAERAAASDRTETVTWALELLAGKLHDKKRDPPLSRLLRTWFDDPRLRRAMVASDDLCPRVLPLLRANLRGRQLDAHAGARTLCAVQLAWGGLGEWRLDMVVHRMRKPQGGPAALRGPITDEEWAAYRAARDAAAPGSRREWQLLLRALPPGPWDASDRAFVERAIAALRAGEDVGLELAFAIASKPDARALAMFDEALALWDPETQQLVKDDRAALVTALGEAAPPEAEPAPAASPVVPAGPPPREWMDEPEEDDDA